MIICSSGGRVYRLILLALILALILEMSGIISHGDTEDFLLVEDHLEILLLNAYHDGYVWSNDLKTGVEDVFDVHFDNYHMRIEHMDTKNYNSDVYMEALYDLYKTKYKNVEFDVIISADDNALKFLLKYGDGLFGDTPIFFCGVNNLEPHDLDGKENIYGVVEKSSIADTVDVAIKQNHKIKDVYLVVDDTMTGRSTKADVKRDMEMYHADLNFEILENKSIHEISAFVSTLDPEKAIVIQTFYVVDVDGRVYPLDYTAKMISKASAAPVYALFDFGFGEGIIGGKFVEGYSQGARAAQMAAAYLNNPDSIREKYIVDDSYNRFKFDYKAMSKFNLPEDVLPEDSILINVPESLYTKHRVVINVSLFVVFTLVVYAVSLRLQIATQTAKITRTQKDLMESEKLASLGRLVAGVAHEINTPIGIGLTLSTHIENRANMVSDLACSDKISKAEFEDQINDIKVTSEQLTSTMHKASELVKSFKRVAVDQMSDDHRTINLCSYMNEIVSSLRNELKKKSVEVRIICKEDLDMWTHAGAIYQILLNLIMNSLMHGFEGREDGIIEITAFKTSDSKGREIIRLKYRDFGIGMSAQTLEKLYEPFFTTKRGKGGSGLGMNIVYNLITQRLHGVIECTSAENAGTEFIIDIPVERPEK